MVRLPEITGVSKLLKHFDKKLKAALELDAVVLVGFTQRYALPVHENKEAYHEEGQAKYLEQPARELSPELGKITAEVTKKTGSIKKGLLIAGLRLQRAAQELVPVDTGALRASAFTALEDEAEEAARKAYERSETIRKRGKKAR